MADYSAPTSSVEPTASSCCYKCKKTDVKLSRCERCDTQYCDRSCQIKDWKAHKKTCAKNRNNSAAQSSSSANSNPAAPSPTPSSTNNNAALQRPVPDPFNRLDGGTYLHDRPEKDVYALVIDCYRLRMDDTFKFDNIRTPLSLYATSNQNPLESFRAFLTKMKSHPGLLPTWFNDAKQSECEQLGSTQGWYDLEKKKDKADITQRYGDAKFPMQLRFLGEAIYGKGPGGQDGTMMRKMQVMQESGDLKKSGMSEMHIDASGMFGGR